MEMSWINVAMIMADMPYVEYDKETDKTNNQTTSAPTNQSEEMEALRGFL